MTAAMTRQLTRDDVLATLTKIVSLRWRGLKAADVPVRFMEDRIAVLLPATAFAADARVRLNGKFQHLMTKQGAHAYLDFVEDWRGAETRLDGGLS